MSAADRERIEAIQGRLDVNWFDVFNATSDVRFMLSQLSALSEALSAASEEIERLKASKA